MSEIANLTIERCDGEGCQMIFVVQTDQDAELFQATWFEGLTKDFCPACKGSARNAAAVADQEELLKNLTDNVVAFTALCEQPVSATDEEEPDAAA